MDVLFSILAMISIVTFHNPYNDQETMTLIILLSIWLLILPVYSNPINPLNLTVSISSSVVISIISWIHKLNVIPSSLNDEYLVCNCNDNKVDIHLEDKGGCIHNDESKDIEELKVQMDHNNDQNCENITNSNNFVDVFHNLFRFCINFLKHTHLTIFGLLLALSGFICFSNQSDGKQYW